MIITQSYSYELQEKLTYGKKTNFLLFRRVAYSNSVV